MKKNENIEELRKLISKADDNTIIGDEFAKLMARVLEFIQANRKELMAASGAIIIVVLAILGVRYIQAANARKQSETLGQILQLEPHKARCALNPLPSSVFFHQHPT